MKRRHFVQHLAGLSAMPLGLSFVPSSLLGNQAFVRPKPGRLRLALAAYSMRKYMTLDKDGKQEMTPYQFIDYCRSLGIDGAELTSYYFKDNVTAADMAKLRLYAQRAGVTISGGAIRNDFCQPAGPKLDADLEHTKKWIDRYSELGVSVIRIFAGKLPKGAELEPTLKHCAENVQKACDYAATKGITLALENHGGVTDRAENLISIVKQVDSEALAINFDSGNFRIMADPYAELEQIAPFAVNAQIKVEMFPNGERQPTDLNRVLSILRNAGYSGWVALEYEAAEEPKEAIPKWIKELQQLIGG